MIRLPLHGVVECVERVLVNVTTLISRKRFLAGAVAAAGAATFAIHPARAAKKYVLKFGVDLAADHPATLHAIAAGKQISEATKGAVRVQVFANSELGDDTHMLAGIRSGAIQMMAIGDNILATQIGRASCRERV